MTSGKIESIDDIFAMENAQSITRSAFRDEIDLKKTNLPRFQPGDQYNYLNIFIGDTESVLDYYPQVIEICKKGKHTGKEQKFVSAVVEAIRNAYQHGNKKDPKKKISIAYKATTTSFEVIISDQGGKINANFPLYTQFIKHREKIQESYSFYKFAPDVKQDTNQNSGIGTFMIHLYSDEVKYSVNSDNGLSVQMIIRKDQNI